MIRKAFKGMPRRTCVVWTGVAAVLVWGVGGMGAGEKMVQMEEFGAATAPATQGAGAPSGAATQVAWLPVPPKGGEEKALIQAKRTLPNLQPTRRGVPRPAMDLSTLALRPLTTTYRIDLASLAQGKGLDAATAQNRFRYATVLNGKVNGVVTVEVLDGNTAGDVTSVGSGEPEGPAGLVAGLDAVGKLEQVRQGPMEVRQLELPPASTFPHPTQVLWLKSGKEGGDWVYTLKEPAYPGGLKQQTLYTSTDFLKAMQPWAEAALKAPPMPPGMGG
jgi:hypothetical protein